MQIACFLFPGITALDVIGPYEVLQRLPGSELVFCAEQTGAVRTDNGRLGLVADAPITEVLAPEILVMPGGWGTRELIENEDVLEWVRSAHATTTWTTSVCTGSLVLAAAGLLNDAPATTHWRELETLRRFGAIPTQQRVVRHGKIITAAGVSSGIDMALTLAGEVLGPEGAQAIQLGIEYDPQPPYDSGSLDKASPEVVALVEAAFGDKRAG